MSSSITQMVSPALAWLTPWLMVRHGLASVPELLMLPVGLT